MKIDHFFKKKIFLNNLCFFLNENSHCPMQKSHTLAAFIAINEINVQQNDEEKDENNGFEKVIHFREFLLLMRIF